MKEEYNGNGGIAGRSVRPSWGVELSMSPEPKEKQQDLQDVFWRAFYSLSREQRDEVTRKIKAIVDELEK